MIACEDDLRFFLNESEVTKLIFDYRCSQDVSRKRHLTDDEGSESSRKIRKKLQEIDLDSDSSMDTDEFDEKDIESLIIPTQNIIVTNGEQPMPSTSQSCQNDQNVNILSVEIIQPTDEVDGKEDDSRNKETDNTADEEVAQIIEDSNAQPETEKKRKVSDSNKIVISDSSDDEEEDTRRNRRHSDGHYSSSYSFAQAGTGDRFEQRSSFDDDFRRFHHHRTYNQYRPRYRDEHVENMNRIYQNAQAMRENVIRNANAIRENTIRNIRSSATIFPQILSTFQAHFRPLFQQPGFNSQQRFPRNFRH
ncbi:uncharacterized protein [Chironomus tepperi]|uniref:uncharacterized protein n=1 Tax=Chironomus tepperi TaxID=113505 RepID=UPI00391F987C